MVALNIEYAPDDGTATDFQPAPEGQYNLVVVQLEKTTSKAGNEMLMAVFQMEGASGSIWHYFNVFHPNASTKNRAIDEFDDFSKAMGFPGRIGDTDQAIGKRFAGYVVVEPASAQHKAKNKVTRFLPVPTPGLPTPPPASGHPSPQVDGPTWG
jgi:hypothetical protein